MSIPSENYFRFQNQSSCLPSSPLRNESPEKLVSPLIFNHRRIENSTKQRKSLASKTLHFGNNQDMHDNYFAFPNEVANKDYHNSTDSSSFQQHSESYPSHTKFNLNLSRSQIFPLTSTNPQMYCSPYFNPLVST